MNVCALRRATFGHEVALWVVDRPGKLGRWTTPNAGTHLAVAAPRVRMRATNGSADERVKCSATHGR